MSCTFYEDINLIKKGKIIYLHYFAHKIDSLVYCLLGLVEHTTYEFFYTSSSSIYIYILPYFYGFQEESY